MSIHAVVAVLQILIRPRDYSLSGGEEKPMSFGIRGRQILTPVVGRDVGRPFLDILYSNFIF